MAQLPEKFRSVFWDTNLEDLDLEKNKAFIISRLYNKGGFDGMVFVHKNYSDEDVIETAKSRRDLHPIVANYLKTIYALEEDEMAYYRVRNARGTENDLLEYLGF